MVRVPGVAVLLSFLHWGHSDRTVAAARKVSIRPRLLGQLSAAPGAAAPVFGRGVALLKVGQLPLPVSVGDVGSRSRLQANLPQCIRHTGSGGHYSLEGSLFADPRLIDPPGQS